MGDCSDSSLAARAFCHHSRTRNKINSKPENFRNAPTQRTEVRSCSSYQPQGIRTVSVIRLADFLPMIVEFATSPRCPSHLTSLREMKTQAGRSV